MPFRSSRRTFVAASLLLPIGVSSARTSLAQSAGDPLRVRMIPHVNGPCSTARNCSATDPLGIHSSHQVAPASPTAAICSRSHSSS